MSLLRRAARSFKLGKEKFYIGSDLEGNAFYERPSLEHDPDDWRHAKRTVEYRVARPLSEYRFYSIPVQWNSWMRRTRREPPTLAELEADYLRQQHLQTNVARLAEEYREEKLRKVEPPLESRGRVLEALAEERRRRGDEEVLDEIVLEEVGATEVEVEVDVEVRGETEGEREKALLRRQFAKENARAGTQEGTGQPATWTPAARPR